MKIYLHTFLLMLFFFSSIALTAQKKDKKKKEEEKNPQVENKDKTTAKSNSLEAEFYFVDGMKYFVLQEYPKALENFQKALVLSPGNAGISHKIAEAYLNSKNTAQAEVYARKALELDKENKYNFLLLAKIYEQQLKWDAAAEVYESFLQTKSASPMQYYELAQLYLKQNKPDKAIDAFQKIENALGVTESVSLSKLNIFLQLNQPDKAITESKKLAENFPENPRHLATLVELLMSNNRAQEATELLENQSRNPEVDPYYLLLTARLYLQQNQPEKALPLMKTAFVHRNIDPEEKVGLMLELMKDYESKQVTEDQIQLAEMIVLNHSNYASGYELLGDMYLLKPDNKKAYQAYLQSLLLGNDKNEVWLQILRMDAENNALDSLVKHSETALELFPNQAVVWLYNGMGKLGKKKYEDAALALEEGKKLAFNDQEMLNDFHLYLADAYNGLKQYGESDEAFETVLKNDPANEQALNNYSYFLALRKEKLDLAKKMAEKLVEMHPKNAAYLDTYGWVLFQSGDFKKARKYLEMAVENAVSGEIVEHYGDVLFKLGEQEKALEQWQKAKKLGGTSADINKKIEQKNLK